MPRIRPDALLSAPLWLALSLVVAVVVGTLGSAPLTVAAVSVSLVLEGWYQLRRGAATSLLDQAGLGATPRFLLRLLALVAAAAGGWDRVPVSYLVAAGLYLAARTVLTFCERQLAKAYASPVWVRNMDLPVPSEGGQAPRTLLAGALAELAVLVPAPLGAPSWLVLALGLLAAALLALPVTELLRDVVRNRRARVPVGELAPRLRPLQVFLDGYRPEVLLHLAGDATAAYQVNVWLEALEHLDQRVLLLVRDRALFDAVAPTTLPMACVRSGSDVIGLDLSSVTVALFPTHVGSNLHIIRLPTLMSAFIGHGDSDKSASINPYAKVYDELWVAGEAAARRWRRAAVGVREDQLVRVGRPQIAGVERVGERRPDGPTLLYAPTWEGWNPDQDYCSVATIGVRLVEAALAHPAGFRVVYRPHPLLGKRDPRTLAASQRIAGLLGGGGSGRHEVVPRGGRSLIDCFNSSDAMATDISSLVSDYLASEKPYAVYDFTGSGPADFVAGFPSASAASVLGRDGSGIEAFLDVLGGAEDRQQEARSMLSTDLIGPPSTRSEEPFQQAVRALSARARTERAAHRAAALPRGAR